MAASESGKPGRGRPRKWSDNAARMRACRSERKLAGDPVPSGTRNNTATVFRNGYFIAIDGEGENYGPVETFIAGTGKQQTEYESQAHRYTLLGASTGDELWRDGDRLSTEDCLGFLCALKQDHPNAIFVGFATGYDCNHMLFPSLSRDELQTLQKEGKVLWRGEFNAYEIEYRPRKSLKVRRFPRSGYGFSLDSKGKWKKDAPEVSLTLWDVWGFFQGSFIATVTKWLGKDVAGMAELIEMKGRREEFADVTHARIAHYNQLECRLLVELMDKVREAIGKLDLAITRWDGAGAIAAALNQKHGVKDYKADCPDAVFQAARIAYSGGHIETCRIGVHKGPVYHYDVNSAYPAEFIKLPNLSAGQWIHSGDFKTSDGNCELPFEGFTLVRIKWEFTDLDAPFFPLFFRQDDGTIIYPREGEGWYWFPEYEAAQLWVDKWGDKYWLGSTTPMRSRFEIVEWWHFQEASNERPFTWVRDYYAMRQEYVQKAKQGLSPEDQWMLGAEKVIKLGLNSLYGKTAQQVGARPGKDGEVQKPPYFQLEWAGFVTSGCRAKLMTAALQKPAAIICFATDALFSTEPLDVEAPKEKTLGLWEFQQHETMVMVMSGIYWPDQQSFSRGFDKESMAKPDPVIEAWKRKETKRSFPQQRLIGIGSAISAEVYWNMRGRFVESQRMMRLTGASGKRGPIHQSSKPYLRLCSTFPRANDFPGMMSTPYKIDWIDDEGASEVDPQGGIEYYEESDAIEFFDTSAE